MTTANAARAERDRMSAAYARAQVNARRLIEQNMGYRAAITEALRSPTIADARVVLERALSRPA